MKQGCTFIDKDSVAECDLYKIEWYPGVVPGSRTVHGEVYGLENDSVLERLDKVEEEGEWYRRERRTTAKGFEVWMYFYMHPVEETNLIEDGNFDVTTKE